MLSFFSGCMACGLAKIGWDGEWMAYYERAALLKSGLSEINEDIDRQPL